MRINNVYLLISIAILFATLSNCSNSPISGGGVEAGNGVIMGSIEILGSEYKKDCSISLFPKDFSPISNNSGKKSVITDKNGNFIIDKVSIGSYTILFQSADSLSSHMSTITTLTDNDTINTNVTLNSSSTLKLSLNQKTDSCFWYIEGTDIFHPIEQDSTNTFVIKRVPHDSISIKFYPETLNTVLNLPETFFTSPGDTLQVVNQYNWTHIDDKNSPLPHNYVYALAVNENAQYWGTYYGFLEIAGTDTTLYDIFNSPLEDSWIKKIFQSSDGTLWICQNSSATSYNNGIWSVIYPDSLGAPYPNAFGVMEKNDSTIMLAASGGIIEITPNDTTFNTSIPLSHVNISSIQQNSVGDLFLGTFNFGFYVSQNSVLDSFNIDNSALISNTIQTLFVDSKDTLWIGTFGGGLYKYSEKSLTKVEKNFTDSIYAVVETSDGTIWAGTSEGDLIRYNSGEIDVLNSNNSPLPESAILALSVDIYDRLFIGTYGQGLYILEEN